MWSVKEKNLKRLVNGPKVCSQIVLKCLTKPISVAILLNFFSRNFVPISCLWMFKKQTSVSHISIESEIISLDAGCSRNPHCTCLSQTSFSKECCALLCIRFGGLAINDFSKNTIPLFLPDVDGRVSTSSPSLKMSNFSWNVFQSSYRSRNHSPADQDSPKVNPCSQAPRFPESPHRSRARGCSPNNQQTRTPYPRNQAQRTSGVPHATRSEATYRQTTSHVGVLHTPIPRINLTKQTVSHLVRGPHHNIKLKNGDAHGRAWRIDEVSICPTSNHWRSHGRRERELGLESHDRQCEWSRNDE